MTNCLAVSLTMECQERAAEDQRLSLGSSVSSPGVRRLASLGRRGTRIAGLYPYLSISLSMIRHVYEMYKESQGIVEAFTTSSKIIQRPLAPILCC